MAGLALGTAAGLQSLELTGPDKASASILTIWTERARQGQGQGTCLDKGQSKARKQAKTRARAKLENKLRQGPEQGQRTSQDKGQGMARISERAGILRCWLLLPPPRHWCESSHLRLCSRLLIGRAPHQSTPVSKSSCTSGSGTRQHFNYIPASTIHLTLAFTRPQI